MRRHTINFIDLFDWNKESDFHYYYFLIGKHPEFEDIQAAAIEVVHEPKKQIEYENYDKIDEGTLRRTDKEGL